MLMLKTPCNSEFNGNNPFLDGISYSNENPVLILAVVPFLLEKFFTNVLQ